MNLFHELIKIVGVAAWFAGLVFLVTAPRYALVTLVLALLLSIWSYQKTKERRHQELLDAQKNPPGS